MFTRKKRLPFSVWLSAIIISLLLTTVALAASGALDKTFSGDGLVLSFVVPTDRTRDDAVQGIAIQPNGKIVAVGYSRVPSTGNSDFALIRYNPNGTLDTTFSGDGRLITNFGGVDEAYDVAVQSNGKIVVAGTKCNSDFTVCDAALARYNANGTLDATFGVKGKVLTDYGGGNNGSRGIAIQPDGKIVLAGSMWNGTDNDFAVYRYNPNGTLDTTFSGDGMAHGPVGTGRQDIAYDLAIQKDGRIVIAGYSIGGKLATNDFAIARLNPNGTADTTFSGDGWQTINFGAEEFAYGLALQPDGKIVVAGLKLAANRRYFAIARCNSNGSRDTSFNGTGKKAFSINPGFNSVARKVLVQSDNKIVIVGDTDNSLHVNDFVVVRLNGVGLFDSTFGSNEDGKVRVGFGGKEFGWAFALQPGDGKYVLGGSTDAFASTRGVEFALARLLP